MKFKELELRIAAGIATEEDFRDFADADVRRIKKELPYVARGLSSAAQIDAALAPLVDGPAAKAVVPNDDPVAAADRAARTRSLIFNVQLGDRMGDVIISNPADAEKAGGAGWELQHWIAAGAPYLWCHDPYDGGAVGRCSNTRAQRVSVTLATGKVVKAWALVSDVEFLADDNLEHSMESWAMVQAGFTASSVGFIPKVTKFIEDEDDRAAWGLGRWGVLYCTTELLECSHVLIPANPWSIEVGKANGKAIEAAVRKMQGQGLLSASRADRLVAHVAKRAKASVVVPDLGKLLAPRLAAGETHAGRSCQGLECMAAQDDELAPGRLTDMLNSMADTIGRGGVDLEALRRGHDKPEAVIALTETALDPGRPPQFVGLEVRHVKTHDCGCGAKTLEQKLVAAEARVRELEAAPAIRNALAVRRAMDFQSEALEQLQLALEDEDGTAGVEEGIESAPARSTFTADLELVLADATLARALEPLVHQLALKASRAQPRSAAPAAAPAEPTEPAVRQTALAAALRKTAEELRASRPAQKT